MRPVVRRSVEPILVSMQHTSKDQYPFQSRQEFLGLCRGRRYPVFYRSVVRQYSCAQFEVQACMAQILATRCPRLTGTSGLGICVLCFACMIQCSVHGRCILRGRAPPSLGPSDDNLGHWPLQTGLGPSRPRINVSYGSHPPSEDLSLCTSSSPSNTKDASDINHEEDSGRGVSSRTPPPL